MDGVTILNEFAVIADLFFIVPLAIAMVGFVVFIIGAIESDPISFAGMLIVVVFVPITAGTISCSYVTRYDALVEPTVSAKVLMDEYKIIERKGDIWVLEPLEGQDDES